MQEQTTQVDPIHGLGRKETQTPSRRYVLSCRWCRGTRMARRTWWRIAGRAKSIGERCRSCPWETGKHHATYAAEPSAATHPGTVPIAPTPPQFPHQDPFAKVKDEVSAITERIRRGVCSDVPALSWAATYFFRKGAEGKRFRPTALLLLASALSQREGVAKEWLVADTLPPADTPNDVRRRQQRIAEITEMIHVASLLHDDVIDKADTRRGMSSLNEAGGNKLAVLAGDFLLARASVSLAALQNTQVIQLLSNVIEHLVTGELMQLTSSKENLTSLKHYCDKTFFKTASLIANSSKSIAILGGHPEDVCNLAFEYGRNVGLAFQYVDDVLDFVGSAESLGKPMLNDLQSGIATAPVIFAAEEFPEVVPLIWRKFEKEGDVEFTLDCVQQSQGLERARELAKDHLRQACAAVDNFPDTDSKFAMECRAALRDLAECALLRQK